MKIVGNCLVKNEDRYLWFAVKSVIDYLDTLLIWDTGSSDKTLEIIKLLQDEYPKKIEFKEIGEVNAQEFSKIRQKMLEKTEGDWLFILDGDEVWWEDSFKKVIKATKETKDVEVVATPYYSVVGDIYHHQEEAAGRYNLAGKKGHLNIRFMNMKIPGLHVSDPYGSEGYFDEDNKRIQERKEIIFVDAPYLHFSNISRSTNADKKVMMRQRKIRHEIGEKFSKSFKYPKVLYMERPSIVPDPWNEMGTRFKIRALVETPLRKAKRKIVK